MNYQTENCLNMSLSEQSEGKLKYIKLENVKGFAPEKTFDCGQNFRFEPVKNSKHDCEFAGAAMGRFFSVAKSGDTLYIYNCDEKFYREKLSAYLGLDKDYDRIRADIAERCPTEYMLSAMEKGYGIRILKQEKWEALCSFIISQNNNIPRIKKIIRAISEKCGEEIDVTLMRDHGATEHEYSFPTPSAVLALGEEGLRELRVGFRASYIYDAASKTAGGMSDLENISSLDTDNCISELCKIKGVGKKVASCAALFSMEKYDSFPIDVWIRRTLNEKFPENFDPAELGEYAGIAQQYMFYAARF
ncbi:MAG: DNA glycosylase [Clostridia bacterium]|nr:DNA glycosylase [Clostridia bacterium]